MLPGPLLFIILFLNNTHTCRFLAMLANRSWCGSSSAIFLFFLLSPICSWCELHALLFVVNRRAAEGDEVREERGDEERGEEGEEGRIGGEAFLLFFPASKPAHSVRRGGLSLPLPPSLLSESPPVVSLSRNSDGGR